jgi:hypothetical protein
MQAALHITTRVLSGGRVEFNAPELEEGVPVEVFVLPVRPAQMTEISTSKRLSMREIAEAIPPGPRPFATWEEYERYLQEEKDSWER